MPRRMLVPFVLFALAVVTLGRPADAQTKAKKPHLVTLAYFLTDAGTPADAEAIRAAVLKVKSATTAQVDPEGKQVRVIFDSHAVSYHQVAQAIADAGQAAGKKY